MLTGGEIPHQPSQIPHQSLPFSPPVILPFAHWRTEGGRGGEAALYIRGGILYNRGGIYVYQKEKNKICNIVALMILSTRRD